MTDVTPPEALTMLGGVATRARLDEMCERPAIESALADGEIVRVTRSLYRLPDVDRALRLAAELRGRLGALSAAQAHGWEIATAPTKPWVMIARGSRAPTTTRAHVFWGEAEDQDDGLVTSRRRTVVDCARRLPFRDALCVVDSALRHGLDHDTFVADAHAVRGKGAANARRVAALATGDAANPFESMLRALATETWAWTSGPRSRSRSPTPTRPAAPGPCGPTSSTASAASCSRPTPGSSTPARRSSRPTAGATPPWSSRAGPSSGSPGGR